MKKIILTGLMMAGIAVIAHAQKGSILLYGNAGFSTSGKHGNAPTATLNADQTGQKGNFNINPGVGYQFTEHVTAGVEGGYNYADNGSISKIYSVGAFGRYSKSLSDIFSLYGQLGAGYQGEKFQTGGADYKASGFYARFVPAIGVNIKNGFALNFNFGGLEYSSLKQKGASNSGNTFGLTFGQGAQFGISKNFGGHK